MSLAGTTEATVGGARFARTTAKLDESAIDQMLVAAVRRGDDRAFERLYARYHRRVAAYVRGMVHDHGRAEDLTQEVFFSALRRMRATDRPIAFRPWIFEIAKNACIDHFRRSRRAEEVSFDAAREAGPIDHVRLADPAPSPDAAVEDKQRLTHLCGAFGGLSDTHHQILVLRELEGLSYQEIGERLGMSRGSVESTLFRARRRLSEEYHEIVSGARCVAVQEMVAGGARRIGMRDRRRVARHVAHCQPCRRAAHAAGVDTRTITAPLRALNPRRVAALLPFPALLRFRRGGGGGAFDGGGPLTQWATQAPALAEPTLGWSKAVAAAAAVLVVGGGAGVVHRDAVRNARHVERPATQPAPAPAAPAATGAGPASAGVVRAERVAGRVAVIPAGAGVVARPAGPAGRRQVDSSTGPAVPGTAALGRAATPAPVTAPPAAAATPAPTPSAPSPRSLLRPGGTAPGDATGKPSAYGTGSLPKATAPGGQTSGSPVTDVVNPVLDRVEQVTDSVDAQVQEAAGALGSLLR